MFQASADRSIAAVLQPIVDEIEERTPGLYVVAAKQYHYSITQSALNVWITEPRRFNVLEEFILRAALELEPPPQLRDLAEVFGLAPIFLEKTCRDLVHIGAIALDLEGGLVITGEGRDFYRAGQIPQPPKRERVYFLVDPITSKITARDTPATGSSDCCAPLSEVLQVAPPFGFAETVALAQVQEVLRATLPGVHDPEQGKIVTGVEQAAPEEMLLQPVTLFLLYDDLEGCWALQARNGRSRINVAQGVFDTLLTKGPRFFLDVFDVPTPAGDFGGEDATDDPVEPDYDERHSRIEGAVRETLWRERKAIEAPPETVPEAVLSEQANDSVTVLRNEKIRPEFMNALNSATREVIVFSPWISDQVIDNEFISMLGKLAARNVWVLIGHGIARSQDREDRPIPTALLSKLHAIRSPQGAPLVRVVWLGGSHAKEVVVDGSLFLHGSFNWLSYRGDRAVRGETVSRITIPDLVADARTEYRELFLRRAIEMWEQSDIELPAEEALTALSIMGALGFEVDALKLIHSSGRYEFLVDWTRIVTNNLVHGDVVYGAGCLAEASDLLAGINPEEMQQSDLKFVWKAALKQIQAKNPGLAQDLLQHRFWIQLANAELSASDMTALNLETTEKPKMAFEYKKSKKNSKKKR